VQNYIHLLLSTNHGKPLIQHPVEAEMHAYLGLLLIWCHPFRA